MNISFKYSLMALALAGTIFGAEAKSFKRGVSENQFQYKAQMEALADGVSWYYNWGMTPSAYLANTDYMEYVPMCWNDNYNPDKLREWVKAHPETKYLLGYNEPNFNAQAHMTPAFAASKWPELVSVARELGLKIVSPALNYSPDAPYNQPDKWMDEFVAIVGLDSFDYVALHNYGGIGVMKDLCTRFHDKYGKDVWVTEFCLWPNEGDANSYTPPATQIASMVESVQWLEQTEWIYRYAWFKAIGNFNSNKGPNYGLLVGGRGEEKRELSDQGYVYKYLSDFDKSKYNDINTVVNATDFVDQQRCSLAKSGGEGMWPIEISVFNSQAFADYQFDIPKDGTYTLILKVSGYGEPTRFNPTLEVGVVDGEEFKVLGEKADISLPNADDVYKDLEFTMPLQAGKQTIRIQDVNLYMPSGIHIQNLRIADASGVDLTQLEEETANPDAAVYTLQGIKAGTAADLPSLPKGIYIVNGKKIAL